MIVFTGDKTIPPGDILPFTTILPFIVSPKDVMLTCRPGKKSILPDSVTIPFHNIISPSLKQKDISVPIIDVILQIFIFLHSWQITFPFWPLLHNLRLPQHN